MAVVAAQEATATVRRRGDARTTKMRDSARSRSAILDAAEEIFAHRGFHGATLAAIGEQAGLSAGLAVYFFGSKAALYAEVLRRVFAQRDEVLADVAAEAGTLLQQGHPEDALRRVVGGYIDFLLENPTYVPLLTRDALAHVDGREDKPRHARTFAEQVIEILGRVGVPEAANAPDHLFLSVTAMCYFPLEHDTTLVAGMGQRAWTRAFRDKRVDHIVRLLLRGTP